MPVDSLYSCSQSTGSGVEAGALGRGGDLGRKDGAIGPPDAANENENSPTGALETSILTIAVCGCGDKIGERWNEGKRGEKKS